MATATRTISAPRGTTPTCTGWPEEVALRMLTNDPDPGLAERPDGLVVYSGSGGSGNAGGVFRPAGHAGAGGRLPTREDRAC